jgi:AraC-like DNA-binding protein
MESLSNQSFIPPIEVIFAETILTKLNVPFHAHPYWELIYQCDGVVETVQENRSYIMRPGMILLHPPFVRHRDIYSEDYVIDFIRFHASSDISWPILSSDDSDRAVGRVCDAICREYHGNGDGREKFMQVLGIELDMLMQRLKTRQLTSPVAQIVSEAKRVLEERYASPPTMAQLAARLGISQSTFYSYFRHVCGVSPKQYLMSIRMNHALGLIRHTDSTLESIAVSCGFNSVSHLSGQVKEETGLSPGALRKIQNNDPDKQD